MKVFLLIFQIIPLFVNSLNIFQEDISKLNKVENLNLLSKKTDSSFINEKSIIYSGHLLNSSNSSFVLDSICRFKFNSDTGDSILFQKYNYAYDTFLNQTKNEQWRFYTSCNCLQGTRKTDFEFDENGNTILEAKYENYDVENNSWIGERKKEFKYLDNNLVQEIYFQWSQYRNQFVPKSKNEYNLYSNGMYNKLIRSEWDTLNSCWSYSSKYDYNFKDSILTSYKNYNWDISEKKWLLIYQLSYTYKENNRVLGTNQIWDNKNQIWINSTKIESESVNQYQVYSLSQIWDTELNKWVNVRLYEQVHEGIYDYTSNFYNWDIPLNQWLKSQFIIHKFDSKGNQILKDKYLRYNPNDPWKGIWHMQSTYNDNDLLISSSDSEWDPVNMEWYPDYKYVYLYNQEGIRTQTIKYNWDVASNRWINEYKYITNFNKQGLDSIRMRYKGGNETWENNKKDVYSYNAEGFLSTKEDYTWSSIDTSFINYYKSYYYYSYNNSKIKTDSIPNLILKCYPNPFSEYLIIENENSSNIELYISNSNGRIIKTIWVHRDKNIIYLNDLEPGTYILSSFTEKETFNKKIIKLP